MKLPEALPAELPGSTPDDLTRSGTRHFSKSPRPRRSHSSIDANADSPTAVDAQFSALKDPLRGKQEHTKPDASSILPNSLSGPHGAQEGVVNDQADRKSAHAPSSLNAVVDRIIERTQSIASTTASVRMPVLAKRYRPRPVHVQKPHLRHHSLPSKLPPHQSQSSLEDDLRDWMVHTAARDQFTGAAASHQSTGTALTRSPTASSTVGSTASRQEMMKLLASFPNVRVDNKKPLLADTDVQDPPIAQDDATSTANCRLPPSEPDSLPMAFETAHSQRKTALVASSSSPPSQPNHPPMASEAAHSQEDMTLVASFPLPPSQPSSPPLASGIFYPTRRTVAPRRSSATTRKPLPPATKYNTSPHSSPKASPSPYHPELFTNGNTIPESSTHAQSNNPQAFEPPQQPQQQPPPPPPPQPAHEGTLQPQRTASASSQLSRPVQTAQQDPMHQSPPEPHVTAAPPQPQTQLALPPSEPIQESRAQREQSVPIRPQNAISAPPVPPAPAVDAETSVEQPRLRTAEAKRRAAHARRMRIAFGE